MFEIRIRFVESGPKSELEVYPTHFTMRVRKDTLTPAEQRDRVFRHLLHSLLLMFSPEIPPVEEERFLASMGRSLRAAWKRYAR